MSAPKKPTGHVDDLTAPARFWPKVEKTDTCWNWIGHRKADGYGLFFFRRYIHVAHRVSLALHGTEIPPGMQVDHICRNRACVRPDHLRIVTPRVSSLENCNSPSAINARKTHCIRGHEFTPENTAVVHIKNRKSRHGKSMGPGTGRSCRQCRRDQQAAKKRAA